jgi:hypothetical protein
MPIVTVTEKTHWKERIACRIDQRLAALDAAEPGLMDRIRRAAHQQALHSLGLADLQAELDGLARRKVELAHAERHAQRALLAAVRRVPLEEVEEPISGYPLEVSRAIQQRRAVHEQELLGQDRLGQEVLRLRREKENLLDTVWLATSSQQIRQLWQQVSAFLGEEETALQREALALDPVSP